MGLFSSKKKIFVSSVVYNLAGDETERPDYLKSLVLGNIITEVNFDVAETIQSGYIKGPGIKMRNFFRWARDNDDFSTKIGMPHGGMTTVGDIDKSVIAANIPHDPGDTVSVAEAVFDVADFYYWADQYMWENHRDLQETEWVSDFDDATGEVVITFEDTSTERFTPVDFEASAGYIYATYSITGEGSEGPVVDGTPEDIGDDPFPDTSGWTAGASSSTPHTESLDTTTTIVVTYSDGSPGSTTGPTTVTGSGDWDETHSEWSKEEYQGMHPTEDRLWSLRSFLILDQSAHVEPIETIDVVNEDMGGGVTKTTTTTTVTDTIVYDRTVQTNTQDITIQTFDGPYVFIYKIGSGIPALDAAVTSETPTEQYFPFIPARLDNQFIDETHYTEAYPIVKKAYKKATGGQYDKFVEKVADNEKLSDIDYTYVMFGVSLNVIENDCRRYLYEFFSKLMDSQSHDSAAYAAWKVQNDTYNDASAAYETWKAAQANESDPLFGTPEPSVPDSVSLPTNEVVIKSTGTLNTNFDMRITWQSIEEETGTGLLEPERKAGELWFSQAPTENINIRLFKKISELNVDNTYLNFQVDEDNWKRLHLKGMVHRNYIYKGKYVEIGTKEALDDADESGFIVPMHYETYRQMPLTKSTQMATACTFAVFNCYVVKKVKWYQRGIFKIILIVVVIAISIYFPPFGAAGGGILGSGAAVGAALGFSGLMGLIVGAVANFIAATLLMKVISIGATAIFGAKIGAIIGAVAGTIAIAVGGSLMQGGTFSSAMSSLTRIDNIINLANSVGGGIQQYVNASIKEIGEKMTRLQDQYDQEQKELDKLYAQNFGYGRASFDAMRLTDYEPYIPEGPGVFMSRTLMTGSDNAQMTLDYVTNFAKMTISTELP